MPKPKRPPVFREDGTIEIHLTRGYMAIIDAEDADLAAFNWCAVVTPQGKVYAQRKNPGVHASTLLLHREVLCLAPGRHPEGDHKDGDGLNCRRCNLRILTVAQNRQNKRMLRNNTSGYMGVRMTRYGTWAAQIGRHHLGTWPTAEKANEARLAAEREEWGVHPQRAHAHKAAGK